MAEEIWDNIDRVTWSAGGALRDARIELVAVVLASRVAGGNNPFQ